MGVNEMKEKTEENSNDKISHQCLIRVQVVYDSLKSAEKKAADFLLHNPENFATGSIVEVSQKAGCSQATIIRLAKKLGYNGYAHMKGYILKNDNQNISLYQNLSEKDSATEVAKKVFMSSIQAIEDTLQVMDNESYERAVDALESANRIIFVGAGDASVVAQAGFLKLSRMGTNVLYFPDYDNQIVTAYHLKLGDVLLAISHSGKTKATLYAMRYAKDAGATVIAITNSPLSPIGKCADILLTSATFHNDDIGEIMTKRIPELCIIESIYINLLMRAGEKRQTLVNYSDHILEYNKV